MLLLGFLGLVILAALIGEPNKSEVPTTQPPTEQPRPATCTATFTNESPQRLCELYWSNQLQVCDPQLREELERRQLIVVPQATCGQPISSTKRNPVEKLSDATVGASEVSRDSSQDDALWVSAVNGTIDRINASKPIQNEADSTILFTGVSIRPFSSLMFWYGSESCARITEAGICTQEPNGLLCDRELFSGQDSRKLCIGSFRR